MGVIRTANARRTGATWLTLALFALSSGPFAYPGEDGPEAGEVSAVELAAERVRYWERQGARYILLEGGATLSQAGREPLRAERAFVRVRPEVGIDGRPSHRIHVYAEGVDGPSSKVRESRSTRGEVKLASSGTDDPIPLDAPPPALPILARANFPEDDPALGTANLPQPPSDPATTPADPLAGPPSEPRTEHEEDLSVPTALPPLDSPPAEVDAIADLIKAQGSRTTPPVADAPIDEVDAKVTPSGATSVPVDPSAPFGGDVPVRFRDPDYRPVQFIDGRGFPDGPGSGRPDPESPRTGTPSGASPVPDDFGPSLAPPGVDRPGGARSPEPAPGRDTPRAPVTNPAREGDLIDGGRLPTDLDPLPGVAPGRESAPRPEEGEKKPDEGPDAPVLPGSQRITSIYAKGGPNFKLVNLPQLPDGTNVTQISGGVNIVTDADKFGTVDIEADSIILWRGPKPDGKNQRIGPDGSVVDSDEQPMEVYLEGHVVIRQDSRTLQGKDDQKTFHGERAYYDFRNDRTLCLDAQVDLFAPGLISPFKLKTPRVDSFHPTIVGANGGLFPGTFQELRAAKTSSTGSRFPNPGYRFDSKSIDIKKVLSDNTPPNDGGPSKDDDERTTWRIDARQNFFYMGSVPVFYWPRFVTDVDDLDPPLRMISFRTNNYFGQQVLLDFNGFKLLGLRKPSWIDLWNVDIDYLSARKAVAVGTEIGWYGTDPLRDLMDPYHRDKTIQPSIFTDYAGYFDVWGLRDLGRDVLGSGPSVLTTNALARAPGGAIVNAGRAGFQRISTPFYQDFRGRINARHMQSFLTDESDPYEDARVNLEAGYLSDRNFLEQYYKRLFDIGLDHEVLTYGIRQKDNWAVTALAEINPNNFNTETLWLPKVDYYRLGDSLFGDHFTYFQHTGADYGITQPASEVNNPNLFAFLPYDPVSNTAKTLRAGRLSTAHELDLKLDLGPLRVIPYVQGQLVGWSNQIDGQAVGRIWGGAGVRADIEAWKRYPKIESELLNVHGINHKIDFFGDYRDTYSNVNLNRIGVQDDLDDNSYEFGRRYFALTNYSGGILPAQYDPRFLMLRRTVSPITGSTDLQASIQTLHLGIHQRLQTKRGPEGKRRVIDWFVFDLDTTYFPQANRDNFGKPFGQNTYNMEWYVGDRTSIVSYGWFEFFDITGNPLNKVTKRDKFSPFGVNVITTGVNINRPPRGNIFIGYSVIDTGPIQTSALNANYSYWMSPKWYTTFGTSYDFGNNLLLGSNASITRVGADYFVSVGITANPLQHSYMFAFEVTPRLSPSLHLGSGSGLTRLDTRYAPVQ